MLTTFLNKLENLTAPYLSIAPRPPRLQSWFGAFLLAHLTVWFIITLLIRHNPPMDAIEGMVWGQQWQLGYDKHPFLAPWLTAAAAHLFGSIDWPIYLCSQFCVIICFWGVWELGKRLFQTSYALIGVMLLEGVLYYNILAASIDPDMLMLPLWALTVLNFYDAITKQNISDWLVVGFVAGLAMITKYESALLLISLPYLLFTTKEGRKSFAKPGIYLALLFFIATIAPNVVWLVKHHFVSIDYALDRADNHGGLFNHIIHPLQFSIEQIGMVLPLFILLVPFYFLRRHKTLDIEPFNRYFLLIVGCGPFLLAVTLSFLTGMQLMSGWGYPLFSYLGLLTLLWLRPSLDLSMLRRFFAWFILIVAVLISGKIISTRALPYYSHHASSGLFPGKEIAEILTTEWHGAYQRPLSYVAGDRRLVAFITAYSFDHPLPYFNWSKINSAWIDEKKVRETGALFVWFANEEARSVLPSEIFERFPDAVPQAVQEIPYATDAKIPPVRIASAFLPPKELTKIKLKW